MQSDWRLMNFLSRYSGFRVNWNEKVNNYTTFFRIMKFSTCRYYYTDLWQFPGIDGRAAATPNFLLHWPCIKLHRWKFPPEATATSLITSPNCSRLRINRLYAPTWNPENPHRLENRKGATHRINLAPPAAAGKTRERITKKQRGISFDGRDDSPEARANCHAPGAFPISFSSTRERIFRWLNSPSTAQRVKSTYTYIHARGAGSLIHTNNDTWGGWRGVDVIFRALWEKKERKRGGKKNRGWQRRAPRRRRPIN